MSGLTGALQHVLLTRTLVILVIAPLLQALGELFAHRWLTRSRLGKSWAIGWGALQVGLVGWHVVKLEIGEPSDHFLLQPLGSVARIGSLDVEVTFALEPRTAGLLLVAVLITSAASVGSRIDRGPACAPSFVAAGVAMALMADGFAPLVVGWTLAGVAGSTFALRGVVAAFASSFALVGAGALLFWTLGGSWGIPIGWDVEYSRRDPRPQLAESESLSLDAAPDALGPAVYPVTVRAGASPDGRDVDESRAYLTMTALPDARIYLAGGETPVASAPFVRLELPAGEVDVEIETSARAPRIRLPHVKLAGGSEVALVPLGPTLGLRALSDQLMVLDAARVPTVRRILDAEMPFHRKIWGNSATAFALALLAFAALAALAQWPMHGWLLEAQEAHEHATSSALLVGVSMPLLGAHLLARSAFLFELVPGAAKVATAIGLAGALLGGVSAIARRNGGRRQAYLAIALFGLVLSSAASKPGWMLAPLLGAIVCLVLDARRSSVTDATETPDDSVLALADRSLRKALFFGVRVLTRVVAFCERVIFRRLGLLTLPALIGLAIFTSSRVANANANAQDVHEVRTYGGTLVIVESGPIELDAEGRAQLTLRNGSDAPLLVTSLYGRTTERDPRIPGTLTVSFDGGAAKGPIEAGASRVVHVVWDRSGSRLSQLFAHVVVESTDVATPQMAIGIVGRAGPARGPLAFITNHVLGILIGLPLFAAIVGLLVGLARGRSTWAARNALVVGHGVAVAATGVQLGLAVWIVRVFDGSVGRADGNDGLQLIEHARIARGAPFEWFVGVDGIGVGMVVLTAAIGFVGVLAGRPPSARGEAYFPLFSLLLAALMASFCAVDVGLFFVASETALVTLALLVASFGGEGRRRAAGKLTIAAIVSGVALLVGFVALSRHAEPTFLIDGARTFRSTSVPELSRVDFLGQGASLFGVPLAEVAFAALFVGFAVLASLAPFHGWLPDLIVETPPAVGIVALALVTRLGLHGLLRFGFGILPEATRWAAPTLAILGVVQIFYAAFAALGSTDRRRTLAYLSMAHVGFAMLGAAALTPQGLSGCLASSFGQALAVTLAMLVLERIDRLDRIDRLEMSRVRESPRLAGLLAISLLSSAGAPGLVGFVGEGLAIFGAFPVYRVLSLLSAIGLVLTLGAHVSFFARIFAVRRERSQAEVTDLSSRELGALVPLALAIVALGLYPRPLLDAPRGTLEDYRVRLNPGGIAALERPITSPDRERRCRFPRRGPRAGCSPSSSA